MPLLGTFEVTQQETKKEMYNEEMDGNDGGYESYTDLEYSQHEDEDRPELPSPRSRPG